MQESLRQATESVPTIASSNDDDSSSDESETSLRIESLVQGRAKRATAGNRLSSLVDKEQDDEIQLLFAENELEQDDSFDEVDEDGSDSNLASSSDDEDDRENANVVDEYQGEKDLQNQVRQDTKKRKAREKAKMPGVVRKKVKIAPTVIGPGSPPQPRSPKKSERVSWIATAADAPTRVSSRKQTIENRETVHQRLLHSEKQRKKIMKQMKEAQLRKEASKPKALTQAQRLEEAARMEKKNAKSLTRWEESEKQRAAEQKAKLEALHNRQLSGPVITWWSGITRWVNGKITQSGVQHIRDAGHANELQRQGRNAGSEVDLRVPAPDNDGMEHKTIEKVTPGHQSSPAGPSVTPSALHQSRLPDPQSSAIMAPQGLQEFLNGIQAYTSDPAHMPAATSPSQTAATTFPNPYASVPRGSEITYSSRDLLALKNIDANAQKLSELQDSALVKKQRMKVPKVASEQCVITGQVARFREPHTGLPYANAYAYKEIQRLGERGPRWSNLLECYVGLPGAAKGVPERFRQPL